MIGGFIGKAIGCPLGQKALAVTSTLNVELPVNCVVIDAPLFSDRYRTFDIPAGRNRTRKITTASATVSFRRKPSFQSQTNKTGRFD